MISMRYLIIRKYKQMTKTKSAVYQIICIILVALIGFTLLLSLFNFKNDYNTVGIFLMFYSLMFIAILVKLIKHFKSESPENKG